MKNIVIGLLITTAIGCGEAGPFDQTWTRVEGFSDMAQLAPGWDAEIIASVDQSYAGWDVEIGDADGDGLPEILTGSAPDSRVYLFRKRAGGWQTRVLLDHVAHSNPGMVTGVRVVDLDGDGRPEILTGTGQEDDDVSRLDVMRTDGEAITFRRTMQARDNTSSYTHGLSTADLNGDGIKEIVSAYCGHGEVIRYDVSTDMQTLSGRKVLQLSGSGEDAWIADVDGDGRPEMILSNGFRDGAARVEIHDLDTNGDPIPRPRVVLDGFEGRHAFYTSFAVGDIDDDGRPELIVGWKEKQDVNRASLVAYHVGTDGAQVAYVLSREDQDLDLGYFEKMLIIADADGDGHTDLLVSTRGDGSSEGIGSQHLGHVYLYKIQGGQVRREQLVDFYEDVVESSWPAVGDIDGDGRPEVVLATGRGDRTAPGHSWVVALRKRPGERRPVGRGFSASSEDARQP
jgi:hypothetical protein